MYLSFFLLYLYAVNNEAKKNISVMNNLMIKLLSYSDAVLCVLGNI